MAAGQVFWLSAQPVEDSLPIRVVPDSGRALVPSLTVPDYSGGSAPDSHRVPGCLAVLALFIAFPELSVKPNRPPAPPLIGEELDNNCFFKPASL